MHVWTLVEDICIVGQQATKQTQTNLGNEKACDRSWTLASRW